MVYYVDLMFSYSPNWINFTISGGGCQNIFVECEPQSCSSYHVQGNALSAWLKRVYYARSPVVDFGYGLLSQHLYHRLIAKGSAIHSTSGSHTDGTQNNGGMYPRRFMEIKRRHVAVKSWPSSSMELLPYSRIQMLMTDMQKQRVE